ncbi:hypothetical protein [Burkholderia sp. IMCC1007]|nr:hypothetical protein [Burkholderia sp. IMCC1007]
MLYFEFIDEMIDVIRIGDSADHDGLIDEIRIDANGGALFDRIKKACRLT